MTYKIIAFDGDGVAAFASALMLAKLDPEGLLVKEADLVAGNAMGAVTALALANGCHIDEIVRFYRDHLGSMFAARSAGEESYSSDALREKLGKLFGAARLSELPLSGLKVMADVERLVEDAGDEWERHSIGCARRDRFGELLLSELAVSAASVEGHFAPHDLEPVDQPHRGRFRGCNQTTSDPAQSAMDYAATHFNADADDMQVLSIGAGAVKSSFPATEAEKIEQVRRKWAWPFSRAARSLYDRFGLARIEGPAALGNRYIRAQLAPSVHVGFDEVSALTRLEASVEETFASSDWERIAGAVSKHWLSKSEDPLSTYPQRVYAARA